MTRPAVPPSPLRRILRRVTAVSLAALVLAACGREAGEPASTCTALRLEHPPGRIPVILIVNDTMRRDRLGAYGGPASTPNFDRFARENLLFEHAFAQAPWTMPSMATLFTSLYPSQHRMNTQLHQEPEALVLADGFVTMPEVFHQAGWHTAAFVANPWMTRNLGFAQGFDEYHDDFASWEAPGEAVSDAALAWIAQRPRGEPFFLFLHYIDSHRPYPPLESQELADQTKRLEADRREVPKRVRHQIRLVVSIEGGGPHAARRFPQKLTLVELAYEKGIHHFDAALGRFLDGLAGTWAGAEAAVVVTSDHGESLFERGYGNHGQGLHDDQIAVPLAARLPGVAAPVNPVPCDVGLIDLLPTLCGYLGLPCPEPTFGRNLLDPEPERPLVAEGVGGQPEHRAIREGRWKLLYQPGQPPEGPYAPVYSLYDVVSDPGETKNLGESDEPAAHQAFARLRETLPKAVAEWSAVAPETTPLDANTRKRLQDLGYLDADPGDPAPAPEP